MMRSLRTASASINARTVYSFIVGLREEGVLLGDGNAIGLAVLANQHLDEIRDRSMIALRGNACSFLQARINAQVERSGLGGRRALPCFQALYNRP